MDKGNICPLLSGAKEYADCIKESCSLWVSECVIPQGETEYVIPAHCVMIGDGEARRMGYSRPNAAYLQAREARRAAMGTTGNEDEE